MKVKVSKKMVQEIKKNIKDYLKGYEVSYEEMPENMYSLYVDSAYYYTDEIDYNYRTNMYKVIRIDYPIDYYAMPKFLRTKDLERIFYDSNKTYQGFFNELRATIEI